MKKKFFRRVLIPSVVIILMLVSCTAGKQTITENKPDFNQERMMDTVKYLSAEDGGRIAGSQGEAEAAAYIADRFEAMGLDTREQSFPVLSFTCNNLSLNGVEGFGELGKEARVLTYSKATLPGGITAEVVPVGQGADEDYEGVDVSGRIALIQRGGEYFSVKTERASSNGAVAALIYDPNDEETLAATLGVPSSIPAVSIARSDAMAIEGTIAKGGKVELKLVVESQTLDSMSANVIATYKSDDNPEGRCMIIGAHYDGVDTPAANDNASGVAVILETAEYLAGANLQLPYDIRFIAFGSEETGLVGSRAYVDSLSGTERNSVIAMLNFDMVGAGEYIEILTVEGTDNSRLVGAIEKTIDGLGKEYVLSNTDRSDHASFSRAGIQAADFQMSPALFYHTDMDTADTVEPGYLEDMCRICIGLITEEFASWVD